MTAHPNDPRVSARRLIIDHMASCKDIWFSVGAIIRALPVSETTTQKHMLSLWRDGLLERKPEKVVTHFNPIRAPGRFGPVRYVYKFKEKSNG